MYEVFVSKLFVLAEKKFKKYKSWKKDLKRLKSDLSTHPNRGKKLQSYCHLLKLRMAIASKNKGKSGGARIIYTLDETSVYIIYAFDKSEIANLSKKQLEFLNEYAGELKNL